MLTLPGLPDDVVHFACAPLASLVHTIDFPYGCDHITTPSRANGADQDKKLGLKDNFGRPGLEVRRWRDKQGNNTDQDQKLKVEVNFGGPRLEARRRGANCPG